MPDSSPYFKPFMKEVLPVPRWRIYLMRFAFMFFAVLGVDSVAHVPGNHAYAAIATSFGVAAFFTLFVYLVERPWTIDRRPTTKLTP